MDYLISFLSIACAIINTMETSAGTAEKALEIRRFTPEARLALEKEGYIIYDLIGESVKSLREAGKRFWTKWHSEEAYQDFEARTSMCSQVAIKPHFFLSDSNFKTLKEQEEMVKRFSQELVRKLRKETQVKNLGIEVIIGEASDYAEVTFRHLEKTGERLFGESDHYYSTRTKTPIDGSDNADVAHVGVHHAVHGLTIQHRSPNETGDSIFVFPLVVPVGNTQS